MGKAKCCQQKKLLKKILITERHYYRWIIEQSVVSSLDWMRWYLKHTKLNLKQFEDRKEKLWWEINLAQNHQNSRTVTEFKEFEQRFKSANTWFKLSTGLNLETFDTILSETNQYLCRGLNLNRCSNSLNSVTGVIKYR